MDNKKQTAANEWSERREERRKRRQRAQILAYSAVLVFILLIAGGIIFGVTLLSNKETPVVEQSKEVASTEEQPQIIVSEEAIDESEYVAPVVELTKEQKLDEIVDAAIEVMPIEDKVAGLFVATPESITGVSAAVKAGDGTKDALSKYGVGGIVYDTKNIKDAAQLKEMLDNTELYSKYPIFLAIKETPGTGPLTTTKLLAGNDTYQTVGASGDTTTAFQAGQVLGANLSQLGFNMVFGVSADHYSNSTYYSGNNYFATIAELSGTLSLAYAQGLEASGVYAVTGLFPGSGMVAKSSTSEMLSTEETNQGYIDSDFKAFQTLIDGSADKIMVGAYSAPNLAGDNTPCCFSGFVVTDYLRNQLGYKGIILSDYMNQKAITDYYSSDEAAIMAIKAGCDMIVAPENFEEAYHGILQAVNEGTISSERIDDALRRIYRVKFADRVED